MNEWENTASLVYLLMLGITSNLLISEGRYLNKLNPNLLLVSLGAGGWTQVGFWDAGGTMSWEHKMTPPRKWTLQWLKVWDSERKAGIWVGKCPGRRAVTTGALEKDSEWKFKGNWDGTESKAEPWGRDVWDGTERGGADWGKHESETWKNQGAKPWNLNLLRFTGEKE